MAAGFYLITSITVGGTWFYAGLHVTDAARITLLQNNSAALWPDTDAQVATAAAFAVVEKNRGATTQQIDAIMASAVAQQGAAYDATGNVATWATGSAGTTAGVTGTIAMVPALADRAFTLTDAYVVVSGAAAAGESVLFQVRKNGVNVAGASYTYNNASTPGARNTIPNLVGIVLNPGDVLDYITVYTAGGAPTLKGTGAYHEVEIRGK